ncbi:MAG: hypothetical protein EPGJADBJ_00347 [Saprospiraceae bacterium]|nr:hypothetical protein [Saprospiraceae bacterium]
MLKKLRESSWWKDAVFSKNISQVIWEFTKWLWVLIVPSTIAWVNKIPFRDIINHQVSFYWVFIAAIVPFMLRWVFTKLSNHRTSKDLLIEEAQKIKEVPEKSGKFIYRFETVVTDKLKVYIQDLNIYCTNTEMHAIPIKMAYGYGQYFCPQCNSVYPCDRTQWQALESGIESIVEHRFEELKKHYKV